MANRNTCKSARVLGARIELIEICDAPNDRREYVVERLPIVYGCLRWWDRQELARERTGYFDFAGYDRALAVYRAELQSSSGVA